MAGEMRGWNFNPVEWLIDLLAIVHDSFRLKEILRKLHQSFNINNPPRDIPMQCCYLCQTTKRSSVPVVLLPS